MSSAHPSLQKELYLQNSFRVLFADIYRLQELDLHFMFVSDNWEQKRKRGNVIAQEIM